MLNKQIFWVASYPRSGNTWVRFLLANLLSGPISNSREMEKIIPDIHDNSINQEIYQFGEVVFCKTHWTYKKVLSLNFETIGAIYILRNPLDVIASHINYLMLADDVIKKKDLIDQFINSFGFDAWRNFEMGTWIENVEGWVFQQKNFPCLVIRYEDMKICTEEVAQKICQFLDLNKIEAEIKKAVEQSSFNNLRTLEKQDIQNGVNGIFKRAYEGRESNYGFLYKGKVGNYRALLTNDQIKQIINRYSVFMEKLGYSLEVSDYLK